MPIWYAGIAGSSLSYCDTEPTPIMSFSVATTPLDTFAVIPLGYVLWICHNIVGCSLLGTGVVSRVLLYHFNLHFLRMSSGVGFTGSKDMNTFEVSRPNRFPESARPLRGSVDRLHRHVELWGITLFLGVFNFIGKEQLQGF